MKSYNHLWEQFISDDNIDLAIKNASRGKRNRPSVKRRLDDPDLKNQIKAYASNFHNAYHKPKQIYDGIQRKKRTIIAPDFDEQIVHHMAVNVLQPIFIHGMYEHSYGSIPKRGAHKGMKTIKKWIKHDGKNCKYVLKMDIRKYFESIPHDIYLENLRKIIHDKRFMAILEEITNVISKGLPLGFYTSQWTANWYLQGLDHYIKEDLKEFEKRIDMIEVNDMRTAILTFANACMKQEQHTHEEFTHIFALCDRYEQIIESSGIVNGQMEVSMEYIRNIYKERLRDGLFLNG